MRAGRRRAGRALAAAAAVWLGTLVSAARAQPAPPTVTGVDIVSPHRLPEARVATAIGELVGHPRLRGVIRDTLDRLWALGLFESVRVEETPEAGGGVRLRYLLARRPNVSAVSFRGDLALDIAELTAAADLGRGDLASAERLERARMALLARYEREGFSSAAVRVETAVDEATNGRDVAFIIDAGDRARVHRVLVHGAERLGRDFVRKTLAIDRGDRYHPGAVRDGVDTVERAYHDRGFFEARVRVDRRRVDGERDRVDLDVTVAEGSHTRVDFANAAAVDEKTLRGRLTFADARVVDETEVRASARQIETLYRERGYAFARVAGALTTDGGEHVVRFTLDEGSQVVVDAVSFSGNPVPAAELEERIETRPRGPFRRGFLNGDAVTRDAQAIAVYLRSRGYPEAAVAAPEIEFSADRRHGRVHFPIAPGPRVIVGSVSVSGARVFSEQEILTAVPLRPGDPWSEAQADAGRRTIERRYARRGFHALQVTMSSERHDGVADVTYAIVEGSQTRIGRIQVRGLVATRERIVRRELPFADGDVLDPEALLEAQRRLGALGLFERVDVEPLRPPPAPFADVTITVRERKPWHADVGVGYTTYEGARGILELGQDNLFGTARAVALRGRLSERGDRADLVYVEPRVFGTLWRGDANLFRERREEIGFSFERYGFGVGVGRDLWPQIIRGLRGTLRYELSQIDRFDVDSTLVAADVQRGQELISTITTDLTLDRRDQPFDPRRGSFHLVSLRTGGVFLGGDADFVKSRFETHWFFDWIPGTVLAISGRLGLAAPLLDDDSLPIEERFFAGGAATVRGYRERRLGPLDAGGNPTGGNAQAIVNIEWRFPIWRWIGGAVFFDTGTVVSEIERLGRERLTSGAGIGLRVSSPVGPIRLDAGYPLDEVPRQDQEVRFYVTVGYPF